MILEYFQAKSVACHLFFCISANIRPRKRECIFIIIFSWLEERQISRGISIKLILLWQVFVEIIDDGRAGRILEKKEGIKRLKFTI
jgi:hypothetical protein